MDLVTNNLNSPTYWHTPESPFPVLPPARTVEEAWITAMKSQPFQKLAKSAIIYHNDEGITRQIYTLMIDGLDKYPTNLVLPSPYFTCFLACDTQGVPDTVIRNFADILVKEGVVDVAIWGPDCQRVHCIFDSVCIQREIDDGINYPVVGTTDHAYDTLEDALDFLVTVINPDEAYQDHCTATLVIAVANSEWLLRMENVLREV